MNENVSLIGLKCGRGMEASGGKVTIYTTNHKIETIMVGGAEKRASVVECYVEAPEKINWRMKVNETSISGVKTIRSGSLMRLVFDVRLRSRDTILESQPDR